MSSARGGKIKEYGSQRVYGICEGPRWTDRQETSLARFLQKEKIESMYLSIFFRLDFACQSS